MALAAYNSTRHASTGFSPNMLMLGKEVSTPLSYFYPSQGDTPTNDAQVYVQNLLKKQREVRRIARHNLKQAQLRQKKQFDKRVKSLVPFKVGDQVQVRVRVIAPGIHRKFKEHFRGPFVIEKVLQDGRCYRLNNSQRVHYEQIKPWNGRMLDFVIPEGGKVLEYKPEADVESIPVTEGASEEIEQEPISDAAQDLQADYRPLDLEPDVFDDDPPMCERLRPRRKHKVGMYKEPRSSEFDSINYLGDRFPPDRDDNYQPIQSDPMCSRTNTHHFKEGEGGEFVVEKEQQHIEGQPFSMNINFDRRICYGIARLARSAPRNFPHPIKEGVSYCYQPGEEELPTYSPVIKYVEEDFIHMDISKAISVASDISMKGPLAGDFKRQFKNQDQVFNQRKVRGQTAVLPPIVSGKKGQYLFYMFTKVTDKERARTLDLAEALIDLKLQVRNLGIKEIAFSVIDPGLDGIPWSTTYQLLDALFTKTNVTIHASMKFYTNILYNIDYKLAPSAGTSDYCDSADSVSLPTH
jgi:hypothetical protein